MTRAIFDHHLGVVILKDKLNGLPFNTSEEEAFRVFATFCGLGVQNVMNYEKICKANAKQSVALEVMIKTNNLKTKEKKENTLFFP